MFNAHNALLKIKYTQIAPRNISNVHNVKQVHKYKYIEIYYAF